MQVGLYFGKPLSSPTWGRAQGLALMHGRASEEDAGPRGAVPALPAEARAGTETASLAAAAATQSSRNARSAWKSAQRCAARYLPRPLTRPGPVETHRAEGSAQAKL